MYYKFIIFAQCLLSVCLSELAIERKEKLLNGLIVYYNNLPNQTYTCDEGVLQNAQQIEDKTFKIEVNLKVSEVNNLDAVQFLTCTATVQDLQEKGITVVDNDIKCDKQQIAEDTIEQPKVDQVEVTESAVERKPVQLDNEIQTNSPITSGEQFIAIPRTQPSTPCIGCSVHVNPQAAGVSDLVSMGIKHLDKHEPTITHNLNTILDVERQVQVVNGIRYILTLLINFNNCNDSETEACISTRACKISVLVKPWMRLPSGKKYRSVIANNCTEEWLFSDDGEILPEDLDKNSPHNQTDNHPSKPDSNDEIKVILNSDVQSQPNQEKTLTEKQVKNIEEQIIPLNQFHPVSSQIKDHELLTDSLNSEVSKQHIIKDKLVKHSNETSLPFTKFRKSSSARENAGDQDKKQAIDEMLDFFNFAGYKPHSEVEDAKSRTKRSYDYDLQVSALVEKYRDIKKILDNAKFVYTLAQVMVEHLNEMDTSVKNRILKNVLAAEEEFENYQHFVYIQALITIPCNKAECKSEEATSKICNGVIDSTDKESPFVLNAFCYTDNKGKPKDNYREVPVNDLVLQNLIKIAIRKIELESSYVHAIRLNKIVSANTQQASGTVTNIVIMIDYINCNKSIPYLLKTNCTVLEKLGSSICEIIIHDRHWLKDKKISYTCRDIPVDVTISKEKQLDENITSNDPQILEMLREALQQLEMQSNRNNKQKIFKINSISSQIITGFVTKIEFLVGYTTCTNNMYVSKHSSQNCDFLPDERFRKCFAHFWDRVWIEEGRQMKVECDDDLKKSKDPQEQSIFTDAHKLKIIQQNYRAKRQMVGGYTEIDPAAPEIRRLAEDSLRKYVEITGNTNPLKVIRIDKAKKQVVSGTITIIDFVLGESENRAHYKCYSRIWDQLWLKKREINVNCDIIKEKFRVQRDIIDTRRSKYNKTGSKIMQDPTNQEYKLLAEESLRKYERLIDENITSNDPQILEMLREALQQLEMQSNRNNKQKIFKINSISSQIITGFVTKIEFLVGYTTCTINMYVSKHSSQNCDFLPDERFRKCFAHFWDRVWIEEGRQMKVECDDDLKKSKDPQEQSIFTDAHKLKIIQQNYRAKRQMVGGYTEIDPAAPEIRRLAEDSLRKYVEITGNTNPLKVIRIDKAKKQVVSGTITIIDFVLGESENRAHYKCYSRIWDQLWLKKREINVNCDIIKEKFRVQRDIIDTRRSKYNKTGSKIMQDPTNQEYKLLAEESLRKYERLIDENITSNDPQILEMLREALQQLEMQSNRNNKQKIFKINSISSQIITGFVTKIEFLVGYTTCTINMYVSKHSSQNCDFLPDERFRKCFAHFWDRVWIEEGRQMKVECDDDLKKSKDPQEQSIFTDAHKLKIIQQNYRAKRQMVGGYTEIDPAAPEIRRLAEDSLRKYVEITGNTNPLKVIRIDKAKKQVVSGTITIIDFVLGESENRAHYKCYSRIWDQLWLKKREINVNCDIIKEKFRVQRDIIDTRRSKYNKTGSKIMQDPTNQEYKLLAEESLRKYERLIDENITSNDPQILEMLREALQQLEMQSNRNNKQKIFKINSISSQIITGFVTKIEFLVGYTTCTNNMYVSKHSSQNCDFLPDERFRKCFAHFWDRVWIEEGRQIKVECDDDLKKSKDPQEQSIFTDAHKLKIIQQNYRAKRQMVGGYTEIDPAAPEIRRLAEDSLRKYVEITGNTNPLKVIRIDKAKKQVVSGTITIIDFVLGESENRAHYKCYSRIWDQLWLKKREINVNCDIIKEKFRVQRDIIDTRRSKYNKTGSKIMQDPTNQEYKLLAEESLRKYERLIDSTIHYRVIEVKHVECQLVNGVIYMIDYTATASICSLNTSEVVCNDKNDIIYCHTRILSKSWLRKKKIDVSCYADDMEDNDENDSDTTRQMSIHLPTNIVGAPMKKNTNDFIYMTLAEEALSKYLSFSNLKYVHKIIKIHSVREQIVEGKIIMLEYYVSPTICLLNVSGENVSNCEIKKPQITLRCTANIWDRPWLQKKDIKVNCEKINTSRKRDKRDTSFRDMRQTGSDDDYVDEEMSYYYGNRALKYVNDMSRGGHLHKLVTIHAVQHSIQMKTSLIRMFIEIAETYCLKHKDEMDLPNCEEMDGLNHKLCLARLWPSPDDELVIRHVSVICDDDDDFDSISGLHLADLLRMSISEYEKKPDVKFKTVHQGEPHIIPSLDPKIPIVINFLLATTNCSKNVNLTNSLFGCFIDASLPSKTCTSYTWLMPNGKSIRTISVSCSSPRSKRSTPHISNTTSDDVEIQTLVKASLEKLEMQSLHRYKQRVLQVNSHTTKITSGKVTTIDFDVGYTSCLKYEWVENMTSCDFIEHLPRRHCIAQIWERLWLNNGRNIDVRCEDDETPLEAHIEFESAEMAMELARAALRHIEAKYPHPKKQKVIRLFSLEKQVVAGIHYRMKIEVGLTDCLALSAKDDCKLLDDASLNKFCRVNVWIRPWTEHPPNFRVSCDYQDGANRDLYRNIQAEHLFYDFITTYSPYYMNDHNELRKRFDIFKENVRKMHEFNIYEKGTARYGVTRFADLTYEEFQAKYTGLKTNLRNPNHVPMSQADIPILNIPEMFDWREYDAVTEVKDQGSCGSCWAFSVTGNIEGQWKMQSGKLMSLSEQELVDCDKLDEGCNGGLPDNAYRAIEQLGGLEAESDYPYEAEGDKCQFNKTMAKVQITGAVNISSNETNMAMWLLHNGPISIGINANAMQFYMGGISHPWKMLCNPTNLDHGVLIVGFGIKDYPLFNKRLPYWIVKNSWGTTWGEQGYYRVFRGDGTCGVNQMASSAVI